MTFFQREIVRTNICFDIVVAGISCIFISLAYPPAVNIFNNFITPQMIDVASETISKKNSLEFNTPYTLPHATEFLADKPGTSNTKIEKAKDAPTEKHLTGQLTLAKVGERYLPVYFSGDETSRFKRGFIIITPESFKPVIEKMALDNNIKRSNIRNVVFTTVEADFLDTITEKVFLVMTFFLMLFLIIKAVRRFINIEHHPSYGLMRIYGKIEMLIDEIDKEAPGLTGFWLLGETENWIIHRGLFKNKYIRKTILKASSDEDTINIHHTDEKSLQSNTTVSVNMIR